MLLALEADALGDPIVLAEPVPAVTTVSHDLSGTAAVELDDGTVSSALELQWRYLTLLEGFVSEASVPAVYKQVLVEWRNLLTDYEHGYEAVADRLDWAAKLAILEGYRRRDGLTWDEPKLRLLDLQYHDVDPNRGLYHRLVGAGRLRRLFTDREVEIAVSRPPESTRAWFRGESLRRYGSAVVAANWDSLVFDVGESTLMRVPMMEPTRGTRALVEELFDESPDAATLIEKLGGNDD
jgi:proteasome accessory factor A